VARIRSIHPSTLTDEEFMALTVECPIAIYLLIGLWMESDDGGVFEWKPLTLKARILPVVTVDFNSLLETLISHNFIKRFEVNSKHYGVVRNFVKYQRPKSPKYVLPQTLEMKTFAGYINGKLPKSGTGRPPNEDSSEPVSGEFGTPYPIPPQMEEEGGRMDDEGWDSSVQEGRDSSSKLGVLHPHARVRAA
jgi:hypothetical protein